MTMQARGAEVTAIIILVLFGLFFAWLAMDARDGSEIEWARLMVLYKGVEALAFASAGVLLGAQVQRPHLESAASKVKTLQDNLQSSLTEAAQALARGRSLRSAIEASSSGQGAFETDGGSNLELRKIAKELFPDNR